MKRARIEFNAYLLILVTLVLYGLFAGVLVDKLDTQRAKIGDKQASVIETYDRAELLSYTLHEAARQHTAQAVNELNRHAGLPSEPCGRIGQYVNWNTPNTSCRPEHVHQTYYSLLDTRIQPELARIAPHTRYEYYADNASISGIPLAPIPLSISTPNPAVDVTVFGFVIDRIEGGVRANTGLYYWRPTFTIRENPGLTDYSTLMTLYDALLTHCSHLTPTNQTACAAHQATITGNVQVAPGENNYYYLTLPSTSTFSGTIPLRVGVYLAPPVTTSLT